MRRESPIKYLAELLEFLPDATLVADRDGLIRMANTRAERIFGYLAHELVDQPVEILVPLQYRSSHRSLRGDFAKNPHNLAMSERPMLWGCRKDQSQFPAEIELNVIETREGTFVVAAIRDVSFKLAQSRELAMHHTLFSTLAGSVEAAVPKP